MSADRDQTTQFVVGTRGSTLALRQTELILTTLRSTFPPVDFCVQTVRTTADHHPDHALDQLPGIGFFVKELELALLAGEIDAAVHSMKDLPAVPTDGLRIAAVSAREDARDVLVAREGLTLEGLPRGARVGTSSPRRAAFLRARRPDLTIVPIRGNVETRVRKVDAGEIDAVCLAAAGVRRIGLDARITAWLPLDVMLPAPGQGALGVQVRADDERATHMVGAVDHLPTRFAVEAERAVLARLQGGCRLPVGAYAEVRADRLHLQAAVAVPDGTALVAGSRSGPVADAVVLGTDLADDLLSRGGQRLTTLISASGGL